MKRNMEKTLKKGMDIIESEKNIHYDLLVDDIQWLYEDMQKEGFFRSIGVAFYIGVAVGYKIRENELKKAKKGIQKQLGDRLIKLRGNKSQEQVARDLNISISSIVKYENGERIPRDELKIQIANYYNVSVFDLFSCE